MTDPTIITALAHHIATHFDLETFVVGVAVGAIAALGFAAWAATSVFRPPNW